jgi:hypothetical protein
MKKLLLLFICVLANCFVVLANMEPIVIQNGGSLKDHLEHFVPFDQPDVYYDSDDQTITIDGDGAVNYYDVEIAPVTSSVPVITTQVSGYYDTIDVSSLPAAEYVITIYSPEDNTYEGFFEIL